MPTVYVAIGSNVEPEKNVRGALAALSTAFGELTVSPVYQTPAVGFVGEDFLNLVVGFDSDMALAGLQTELRRIEEEHGRLRSDKKFSARTLDLDLLLYGDEVHPDLNIPRDEIEKYAFVLKPLADLAPERCHPVLGTRYADLWQAFDQTLEMTPVAPV